MKFNETDIKATKSLIRMAKKISIITHFNPDADAVGSSIGLYYFLKKRNKDVTIIMPNPFPTFLDFFAANVDMLMANKYTKNACRVLKESDLIFCLDFNMIHRVGNQTKDALSASTATKILIDHHQEPSKEFNIKFSYPLCCSTTEVLAHFIEALSNKNAIDSKIARAIYIGMCTDTGSFSYNCNHSQVYSLVSELVDKGVKIDNIHQEIYNTFSENRLRLLGYAIYKKLKVFPKYNAAYICLSNDELQEYKFQAGDTEGLVNLCLHLNGVNFGCLITERNKIIRLSFRSKKNTIDVNKFARKHWEGGGHIMASGGTYQGELKDAIAALEEQIKTL